MALKQTSEPTDWDLIVIVVRVIGFIL